MANDTKLSALALAGQLTGAELIYVVQNGTSYGATISTLLMTVIDTSTHSQATLSAITTINTPTPNIKLFVNNTDGDRATYPGVEVWQLLASTNPTGAGWLRPYDFDSVFNAKVWYKAL